jgi:hypothetical protein
MVNVFEDGEVLKEWTLEGDIRPRAKGELV